MDNQEVFNTVARHLFTQGERAVGLNEAGYEKVCKENLAEGYTPPNKEDFMQCQYRTSEGLKCAIGCLIPDELYRPNMETRGIYSLLDSFPGVAERLDIDMVNHSHRTSCNLLADLQSVHDNINSWHDTLTMRQRLADVAQKFELDPAILNELKFQRK